VIDVAIDSRRTARMSLGMRACVDALVRHLPAAAPDLRFAFVGAGENFSFDEQARLPVAIARTRARLAYYPTPYAPAVRGVPYVIQVHDLIHLRFPELSSPAVKAFYATLGRSIVRGAARIVVADAGIGEDVQRRFGVAADRLRVIPLGYDPALLADAAAERRDRPYLLYAGNRRRHKNLDALIDVWRRLPGDVDVDLVVAGPSSGVDLADEVAGSRRLIVTGEVDAGRLRRLYRGAVAYVHPALAEGFGIPLLEALAVGTPVIASEESVPAIVRPYAWTFAADDREALSERISAAVRSPAGLKRLASEGALSVRAYTWQRFAETVASVFRELIDRPGIRRAP
jgi:glycosyltransferase involved in cell wall biosynthesis